jgi:hypothetical protein
MMNAQGSDLGDGPADGMSNRIRPPRNGDTRYVVYNPDDPSETITDFDLVQDDTLWEDKTVTGQDPRMDTSRWIKRHLLGKLDKYRRAQQYTPGWEHAPLGYNFTRAGSTPQFRAAVQQAVDEWKAGHPGVEVRIRWAP